jgi:hypothetical protein
MLGMLAMGLVATGCAEKPVVVAQGEALPIGDCKLSVIGASV